MKSTSTKEELLEFCLDVYWRSCGAGRKTFVKWKGYAESMNCWVLKTGFE